jgi:pentatricopeptide repeat protein
MVLDEVLYNTLLDCFARNSDEENLIKIFCDMRKKNVKMGVITYGVVIKLYTNIGDTVNANEVFEDMINKGIKPTVVIYQLLLRLYSRQRMPYKAIDVFRNMLLMKVSPDYMIYTYIIKLCFNNFYLKESVEFIRLSIEDGIQLEESYYDYVVDYIWEDNKCSYLERRQMMAALYELAIKKELNYYISKYIIDKMYEFLNIKMRNTKNLNNNKFNKSNQQIISERDCYDIEFDKLTINQENFNKNSIKNKNNHNKTNKFDAYSRIEPDSQIYHKLNTPGSAYKNQYKLEDFNDNQSQFSSISFFNIENKKGTEVEKEFEYELDLNSKNEYFYPCHNTESNSNKSNNRNENNKNYIHTGQTLYKGHTGDAYVQPKGQGGNKYKNKVNGISKKNNLASTTNFEKSIYDL